MNTGQQRQSHDRPATPSRTKQVEKGDVSESIQHHSEIVQIGMLWLGGCASLRNLVSKRRNFPLTQCFEG